MRWAYHASRGVLPTVARLSVISEPQKWGGLGPVGAVEELKRKDVLQGETHLAKGSNITYFRFQNVFRLTVVRSTSSVSILIMFIQACG